MPFQVFTSKTMTSRIALPPLPYSKGSPECLFTPAALHHLNGEYQNSTSIIPKATSQFPYTISISSKNERFTFHLEGTTPMVDTRLASCVISFRSDAEFRTASTADSLIILNANFCYAKSISNYHNSHPLRSYPIAAEKNKINLRYYKRNNSDYPNKQISNVLLRCKFLIR